MSKRKPSPFQNCETRETFLDALQRAIASGKVTPAVYGAAKLLCKMKGWDIPAESVVSVPPTVESPLVVVDAPEPKGDGLWRWREDSKKPWSPPLTTEQMVETYNRIAAAGIEAKREAVRLTKQYQENPAGWQIIKASQRWEVSVLTPKGLHQTICSAPCTVEMLDALNEEPDPRTVDHW